MPSQYVGLRINVDLLTWLKDKAEKENRTLSNMIVSILMDAKKEEEKEHEK